MSQPRTDLANALFSELLMADQLARNRLSKTLPKGMELSHFGVLNLLAKQQTEMSPAELARAFHVTRGAMTNTLAKLEWAGYVHIRPDWEDARRKMVAISPAGRKARDAALAAITPLIDATVRMLGEGRVRQTIPVLRSLRQQFGTEDGT